MKKIFTADSISLIFTLSVASYSLQFKNCRKKITKWEKEGILKQIKSEKHQGFPKQCLRDLAKKFKFRSHTSVKCFNRMVFLDTKSKKYQKAVSTVKRKVFRVQEVVQIGASRKSMPHFGGRKLRKKGFR